MHILNLSEQHLFFYKQEINITERYYTFHVYVLLKQGLAEAFLMNV